MKAELSMYASGKTAVINLSVPSNRAEAVLDTIRGVLTLTGHKVEDKTEEDALFSVSDVFPDSSPAMLLRGLRGKEELTQAEFAKRVGISQNMLSDMENGKRPISLKMAKRIGLEFNMPYKGFV